MYAANQNGNQNGLVARPVCYTETVKEVHTAWGCMVGSGLQDCVIVHQL